MRTLRQHVLPILTGIIVMMAPAIGQVQLRSIVIGSGGTLASNGSSILAGTLGQPVIGPVTAATIKAWQGFWYLPTERITNAVPGVSPGSAADGVVLHQNVPNPFSSSTTFRFSIPKRGHVSLKVYDAVGKEVRTLVDDMSDAGMVTLQLNGDDLESGYYSARLVVDGVMKTIGMVVVR